MNIGLLFGMIVAIMTMGFILVFGFQQISTVSDLQSDAETMRVLRTFESSVKRVYSLSGESSQEFLLSLPDRIEKVCFIPLHKEDTNIDYRKSRVATDIKNIITRGNAYQISTDVATMRFPPNADGGTDDRGYSMLIFYTTTAVPQWYEIPHLNPSKPDGVMSEPLPLCVTPGTNLWLLRDFNENGAWVDIREA